MTEIPPPPPSVPFTFHVCEFLRPSSLLVQQCTKLIWLQPTLQFYQEWTFCMISMHACWNHTERGANSKELQNSETKKWNPGGLICKDSPNRSMMVGVVMHHWCAWCFYRDQNMGQVPTPKSLPFLKFQSMQSKEEFKTL